MLTGNYISSAEVIREVYRDNGYTIELSWGDATEWVVDCLRLIGAPNALFKRYADIKVDDYRGRLPIDLYWVEQVGGSFGGCLPFPMRQTTNSFHPTFTCNPHSLNINLIDDTTNEPVVTTQPIGQDISGNPVFMFQNGDMSLPRNLVGLNTAVLQDPTYSLSDSFIFTNYKDGRAFISYWAMPIDDDGLPLIPDDIKYKEAVKCYIREKIDYKLWRKNEIAKDVYEESKRESYWYIGAATNAGLIPGVDGMESLLNMMRIIPQRQAHNQFFKALGR